MRYPVMTIIRMLTCLFLAGSVMAQTYALPTRRDSIRFMCYSRLNMPQTGTLRVDTTNANYAIDQAYANTCDDFDAIEKLDTVIIARADEGGSLNSDFLRLRKVFKLISDSVRIPMGLLPLDSLELVYPQYAENLQKRTSIMSPNRVYSFNQKLFTHPKQYRSDADTMLVYYWAMGAELVSDTAHLAVLPGFVEKVISYACGLMAVTAGRGSESQGYFNLYGAGK